VLGVAIILIGLRQLPSWRVANSDSKLVEESLPAPLRETYRIFSQRLNLVDSPK
jgi:hypothetical protein